jgi:hypothetical protein
MGTYLVVFFAFKMIKRIAIFGNLMFILWITYNGIDEGFRGTIHQKISYIGLITLLALNIVFLRRKIK